jgi:replicative superfamily II helicase
VALDEIHVDVGEDAHAALVELCSGLDEPTLIYCQSPRSVRQVLAALIDADVSAPHASLDRAVEWTSQAYHPDWSVCRGLAHGVGVHHGQLPRALAAFMVRAFKERRLRFLICTSSLIEGVNTPAKNVVVFDKKIGRTDFDFFDYGNIRGRSGRMSVHHVGRVYLFHATPSEELPEVDIPALSQPDDVPSSLLLGLEPDPSLPTSDETPTIRYLLTMRARFGACWDVEGQRTRRGCRGSVGRARRSRGRAIEPRARRAGGVGA